MAASKRADGPLVRAASALETDLARYEEQIAEATRLVIASEKGLMHSKTILEACAETERKMRDHLQALASAMHELQMRQQTCVEETVATAKRIEERIHDRAALLERFGALGARAREVDEPVKVVMQRRAEGAKESELASALGEVIARTDSVLEDADAVAKDAQGRGWEDIAREATSLKQQLQSARNKVMQAQKDMASRQPS
jgi:chromosome segregation ATPase